ncbi:hypothetical protein F5050DRAFT_1891461 [Lentinula boryana]|uniref:Uncharacterized protein n=1 Tax=Lentinula boryana TaxID=40481 RepID=A0ABQ8QQX1_9AGAR|nr:hypothetical protein F5050DRAFT_1891461 [Lentinula boryana]
MRFNHIYVLLGLFAVVHAVPLDASGSDRLNLRSVKENVNRVDGNSGTNGAHSNSGTNGAHSYPEPGSGRYTILPPAGGSSSPIPQEIIQRVDDYLRTQGHRLTGLFTNQYVLADLTAEFQIQVTADGQTHEYTIPHA